MKPVFGGLETRLNSLNSDSEWWININPSVEKNHVISKQGWHEKTQQKKTIKPILKKKPPVSGLFWFHWGFQNFSNYCPFSIL